MVTVAALVPYLSSRSQPISDYPAKSTIAIAAHAAIGAAFIAVGLLAWARRPENRSGKLMTLAGFVWFSTDIGWISTPATFIFADEWRSLFYVVFIWLLLAFPSGALASRVDRAFVIAVAVWVIVVRPFPSTAFYDPHLEGPFDAPPNPLLIRGEPSLNARIDHWLSFGDLAFVAMLLVLVTSHWRRSGRHTRRWLAPAFLLAAISSVASLVGAIDSQQTLLNWTVQLTLVLLPLGFLVGVLRSRLARASVADLVLDLERTPSPAGVQTALARALDDPTLEVGYRLADSDGYVDANGKPFDLEQQGTDRGVTVVRSNAEPVAVLIHEAALADEPELVNAVSAAARLALENQRLHAELRAQLEEVRASRARIISAGDAERRRIERNLHDGAQQRLVALGLVLQLAREDLGDHELLTEAELELQEAIRELRELASGIHPAILSDAGLAAALKTAAERCHVPVSVHIADDLTLPPSVESTAYFIAAEALTNVSKHACASHASLSAERRNHHLHLTVEDDGIGGADPSGGSGLRGLTDRAEASGGSLHIRSQPGHGTQIDANLPCA